MSKESNLKASKAKHLRQLQLKRGDSIHSLNGKEKNDGDEIVISNKIKIRIDNDIESEINFENKENNEDDDNNNNNINTRLLSDEILETLSIGYKDLSNIKLDKLSKYFGNNSYIIYQLGDTLRGQLWRAMLGVSKMDLNDYLSQINKKESRMYNIIRSDASYAFRKEGIGKEYEERVVNYGEVALVRILNSYCHKYSTNYDSSSLNSSNGNVYYNRRYMGGIYRIAELMLYVMPELESYHTFISITNIHLPTYFNACPDCTLGTNKIGMNACCYLTFEIIALLDKELYHKLVSSNVRPDHLFSMTFETSIKPFYHMLKIWDFLVCFGMHMNPIVIAAQLITNRTFILQSSETSLSYWIINRIRSHSGKVIACSMQIMANIKLNAHAQSQSQNGARDSGKYNYESLWNRILKHATDLSIAREIVCDGEKMYFPQPTTTNVVSNSIGSNDSDSKSSSVEIDQ